jgi:hypothetical protein
VSALLWLGLCKPTGKSERIQETDKDPGTGIFSIRGDWTRDHSLEIEIPDSE